MPRHWSFALSRVIENPKNIVLTSSETVVIKNSYPRAMHHYLVIPKTSKIHNVFQLSANHLGLLEQMGQLAKSLIAFLNMEQNEFLIGFICDASIRVLHLHVVSTDFVSKRLTKPRHWYDFHTSVFLPYDAAYDQLKNNERIKFLSKDEFGKIRSGPLICNKCDFKTNVLFHLKSHLNKHWLENKKHNEIPNNSKPVIKHGEVADQQRTTIKEPLSKCNEISKVTTMSERIDALTNFLAAYKINDGSKLNAQGSKALEVDSVTTPDTTIKTPDAAVTSKPKNLLDVKFDPAFIESVKNSAMLQKREQSSKNKKHWKNKQPYQTKKKSVTSTDQLQLQGGAASKSIKEAKRSKNRYQEKTGNIKDNKD